MRNKAILAVTGFVILHAGLNVHAKEAQIVRIHDGAHWIWYAREDQYNNARADIERMYDYADKAYERLTSTLELHPPDAKLVLLVWPKTGGGFAAVDIAEVKSITGKASPGIAVSFDAFSNTEHGIKGFWAYTLTTHEMVNVVLARTVGTDWPVDWWADHLSPFPFMTAVQIEQGLVPEVAAHHKPDEKTAALVQMFLELKDQYGWQMFHDAFGAVIDDGIKWHDIGENPSALRTNYVAAYLQIGATGDVFRFMKGRVPNLDPDAAKEIIRLRQKWRSLPERSPMRAKLKEAFLKGDYRGR